MGLRGPPRPGHRGRLRERRRQSELRPRRPGRGRRTRGSWRRFVLFFELLELELQLQFELERRRGRRRAGLLAPTRTPTIRSRPSRTTSSRRRTSCRAARRVSPARSAPRRRRQLRNHRERRCERHGHAVGWCRPVPGSRRAKAEAPRRGLQPHRGRRRFRRSQLSAPRPDAALVAHLASGREVLRAGSRNDVGRRLVRGQHQDGRPELRGRHRPNRRRRAVRRPDECWMFRLHAHVGQLPRREIEPNNTKGTATISLATTASSGPSRRRATTTSSRSP